MKSFPHRLFLAALVSITVVGCATQPLSSIATKYKAVDVSSEVRAPDKYFYQNATGKRARGVGEKFGLIGALVGGAVGADSESKGFKRFDQTAGREKVEIKSIVRGRFITTLQQSHMTALNGTNPEATFHLQVVGYGIAPVNGEELGGMIRVKAVLIARNGQTVWHRMETGTSSTTATLESYEKNPRLWPRVINEAAEKVARQLVLYTNNDAR
jgi:hypothetical protein